MCRPGDGQVPHSLAEDDASVGFEAYQRNQVFNETVKMEHVTGYLIFLQLGCLSFNSKNLLFFFFFFTALVSDMWDKQ